MTDAARPDPFNLVGDALQRGTAGFPRRPPYGTSGGVPLTDDTINALAAEAEAGYDPEQLRPRAPSLAERTWSLPPEPDPDVTAVRAERQDGSLGPYWHRDDTPAGTRWIRYRNNADPTRTDNPRDIKRWVELFAMSGPDNRPVVRLVAALVAWPMLERDTVRSEP